MTTVDLHGLSVLDARRIALSHLRACPPRTVTRLVSGRGIHSENKGVSAIKTELERCFDSWGVRWRWEHGCFIVVTPDDPSVIGRSDNRGGGGSRPQVALASKAELTQLRPFAQSDRPWNSSDSNLRPESFPTLGGAAAVTVPNQWNGKKKSKKKKAKKETLHDFQGDERQSGVSSYEQLVAEYQAASQQQSSRPVAPADPDGGMRLVRQASADAREATAAALADAAQAQAEEAQAGAELAAVRADAIAELSSWGFERGAVEAAVAAAGGNVEEAAALLLGSPR